MQFVLYHFWVLQYTDVMKSWTSLLNIVTILYGTVGWRFTKGGKGEKESGSSIYLKWVINGGWYIWL